MIEIELKIKIEVPPREISNPLPNTVRGDGVFHGNFSEAELPKMGMSTNDIFEKLCHGRFPTLYPTLLEEMESFTGLQRNFSEAELPKMP
jgi:hypothetical protein